MWLPLLDFSHNLWHLHMSQTKNRLNLVFFILCRKNLSVLCFFPLGDLFFIILPWDEGLPVSIKLEKLEKHTYNHWEKHASYIRASQTSIFLLLVLWDWQHHLCIGRIGLDRWLEAVCVIVGLLVRFNSQKKSGRALCGAHIFNPSTWGTEVRGFSVGLRSDWST